MPTLDRQSVRNHEVMIEEEVMIDEVAVDTMTGEVVMTDEEETGEAVTTDEEEEAEEVDSVVLAVAEAAIEMVDEAADGTKGDGNGLEVVTGEEGDTKN